jgi:hypothetical protein
LLVPAILQEAEKQRYAREPLLYLHLGRASSALKSNDGARTCFGQAIQFADDRAAKTHGAERKTRYQSRAEQVRLEQKKLSNRAARPGAVRTG